MAWERHAMTLLAAIERMSKSARCGWGRRAEPGRGFAPFSGGGAFWFLALLFRALLAKKQPMRKGAHAYRIGAPLLTKAERSLRNVCPLLSWQRCIAAYKMAPVYKFLSNFKESAPRFILTTWSTDNG